MRFRMQGLSASWTDFVETVNDDIRTMNRRIPKLNSRLSDGRRQACDRVSGKEHRIGIRRIGLVTANCLLQFKLGRKRLACPEVPDKGHDISGPGVDPAVGRRE